jgi:hypothetical protein
MAGEPRAQWRDAGFNLFDTGSSEGGGHISIIEDCGRRCWRHFVQPKFLPLWQLGNLIDTAAPGITS